MAEFDAAYQECDVILTPTTPATAFKIGENIGDPLKMYLSDVCTVTVNIAGLPAVHHLQFGAHQTHREYPCPDCCF